MKLVVGGKYGFGQCRIEECYEDAVVGLQDRYLCLKHFDEAMAGIGKDLAKATEVTGVQFAINVTKRQFKKESASHA